jgi:GxxExxY protein
MKDDDLTQKIIGCAYKIHNVLGPGFLEKVYENALRIELEGLGLTVKQQEPIKVIYAGQVVGEYYADLWVDEHVVI